jgi:hypothetical protein
MQLLPPASARASVRLCARRVCEREDKRPTPHAPLLLFPPWGRTSRTHKSNSLYLYVADGGAGGCIQGMRKTRITLRIMNVEHGYASTAANGLHPPCAVSGSTKCASHRMARSSLCRQGNEMYKQTARQRVRRGINTRAMSADGRMPDGRIGESFGFITGRWIVVAGLTINPALESCSLCRIQS